MLISIGGDTLGQLFSECLPPSLFPPSVLWKFHGATDFKENLCEFSADSLKVLYTEYCRDLTTVMECHA